jgi:PAS domain S-box-containing protein
VVARIQRSWDTGEPWEDTFPLRGVDGRYRWFLSRAVAIRDNDGRILRWVGTNTDITAHRDLEQALRVSEERLRLALQADKMAWWDLDVKTGDSVWSDSHFAILGYEPTLDYKASYAMWVSRLHPDDRDATLVALEDARRERKLWSMEHRIVRPDNGQTVWIQPFGRFHYEGDEAVRSVGVFFDITEQKRVEGELRRLAAELSEADRRKDEFLATLAHELRNPLAPIRNGLEVLAHADGDPQLRSQSREMMRRQVEHMTRLIDDLLDIARISRGKLVLQRAHLDLAVAIQNAIDTSRPLLAARGQQLAVELPAEPIQVDGDATRLSQVFANLLDNAAKYGATGGHVRLAVGRDGSEVEVTIADDGVGIPADMLAKVFDMFTQVDRSLAKAQGGLGIGLSIVKRLVEMHGGSIAVHSDGEGKGSTFRVRLPALAPGLVRGSAATDVSRLPVVPRRILVVDDNHDGADSLALMLQVAGHTTATAYDGAQALALHAAFRPEVVLMDIGMPDLSGYEVCARMRRLPGGGDLVLIAQTGWGQEDDRKKAQAAGFDFHLTKPIDPAALAALLARPRPVSG